jgi:hypothetical protein
MDKFYDCYNRSYTYTKENPSLKAKKIIGTNGKFKKAKD